MKIYFNLLLLILITIYACTTSKKVIPLEKTNCQKSLDSLGRIFEYERYGIYSGIYSKYGFPLKEDARLNSDQYEEKWGTINRYELGRLQLTTHIDTFFNNNRQCNCEWNNQAIMKSIGHPSLIEYDGTYIYRLANTKNCPCKECPLLDTFDGCEAFVIRFNKEGCIQGKVTFRNHSKDTLRTKDY